MQMLLYRQEQLGKFSPAPWGTGGTGTFVGALVQRMASRVLLFFVRQATLLRPLSHAGSLQLAKASLSHNLKALPYCTPSCVPLLVLAFHNPSLTLSKTGSMQ